MIKYKDKTVNILQVDRVEAWDYPNFVDAYISEACYSDGVQLSMHECSELTEMYPDVVNEMAHEKYHESRHFEW